jgi:putative phosphoribosyl transferase
MLAVNTYHNRTQAGRVLAQHLAAYLDRPDAIVLGLPRGGVPVALEVAGFLSAPLDVFLVRKLGLPGHTELAMGAIASGGICLLDEPTLAAQTVSPARLKQTLEQETTELERQTKLYRGTRPLPELSGRLVILVDDGVATGFSIRAAIEAIRRFHPSWLIVAIPVGPMETCDELEEVADEVVCPLRPSPFQAVGLWYEHFEATSDEEVQACLRDAGGRLQR